MGGRGALKERREREERERAAFEASLRGSHGLLRERRRERRQKKKPAQELLGHLRYAELRRHQIRDVADYRPRSYNLDRQVVDLIDHLFVRYPVPAFLYPVCMEGSRCRAVPTDPFSCLHDIYREWFVTLAQGGSFPKAVKGVMTSREAAAFLRGDPHRLVHENVWLAKLRVAGVPPRLQNLLIDRVLTAHSFDDPGGRMAELIHFFARFHGELGRDTLPEVMDFLAWKLDNDPEFRLKGRTAGSVVRLSNEWHRRVHRIKLGRDVEWDGLRLADWTLDEGRTLWEALELRSSAELMKEGDRQRHCVYSYVQWCLDGRCSIFSLRRYAVGGVCGVDERGQPVKYRLCELTRLTLEVTADRVIRQARGESNRLPTSEERAAVLRWAGVNGFIWREDRW